LRSPDRRGFGSYRLEQTKNAGQVALEMGNSAGIVMKHYFEIIDEKATREYWLIKPIPRTDRKIVARLLRALADKETVNVLQDTPDAHSSTLVKMQLRNTKSQLR